MQFGWATSASILFAILGFSTGVAATSTCVVYATSFESNWSGWRHGGPGDEWELGTPSHGAPGARSGVRAWGTDLDSTYEPGSAQVLVSPVVQLPLQANFIEVRWSQHFAAAAGDSGLVSVSGAPVSDRFMGSSGGWADLTADISTYAGQAITVDFTFQSDGFDESSGWHLDDFSVTAYGVTGACPQGTPVGPRLPHPADVELVKLEDQPVQVVEHGLTCSQVETAGSTVRTYCFPESEGEWSCGFPSVSTYVEGEGGAVTGLSQCYGSGTGALPTASCTADYPDGSPGNEGLWYSSCDAAAGPDDSGDFAFLCSASVQPDPAIRQWYVTCAIAPPPEGEFSSTGADDTCAQAADFGPSWSGARTDSTGQTDSEDWSKTLVYAHEELHMTLVSSQAHRVGVYLSCNGTPVDTVMPGESATLWFLDNHDPVYFRVFLASGTHGAYRLSFEIHPRDSAHGVEAGDDPVSATPVTTDNGFAYFATLDQRGGADEDWWSFTAPASSLVTFQARSQGCAEFDPDLSLHRSDGTLVATSTNAGTCTWDRVQCTTTVPFAFTTRVHSGSGFGSYYFDVYTEPVVTSPSNPMATC